MVAWPGIDHAPVVHPATLGRATFRPAPREPTWDIDFIFKGILYVKSWFLIIDMALEDVIRGVVITRV